MTLGLPFKMTRALLLVMLLMPVLPIALTFQACEPGGLCTAPELVDLSERVLGTVSAVEWPAAYWIRPLLLFGFVGIVLVGLPALFAAIEGVQAYWRAHQPGHRDR